MEPLLESKPPDTLNFVILLTIPVVLLIFLSISIVYLIRDLVTRRAGSRFQSRVLRYFIIVALLAAAPATIITTQFFYEVVRIWENMKIREALTIGQDFALDSYHYRLEALERTVREKDLDSVLYPPGMQEIPGDNFSAERLLAAVDPDLAALQDFELQESGSWEPVSYAGPPEQRLLSPPGTKQGFVLREIPRDTDIIRYITFSAGERGPDSLLRVVSYGLGDRFDSNVEIVDTEIRRFEAIAAVRSQLKTILLFYYGVFFFPTLLMTIIIAITLSSKVTQPIVELSEATQRVAEGDFSIQILSRPKDELGRLIASFNSMVRDLEQSQNALVKAEKISIWQNMAQQLAHEIKNPLTPIRLSAERVLRRWRNEPEQVGEILENSMLAIIQEVESLSTLLTEFRTLSKPIEPSLSTVKIGESIEETISPYRSSYPGITFITDHVSRGISVKIDRRHITQVLTNLIINAIDAMHGSGPVEIRTDLVKKRDSRYCRLSIKDAGKGIPESEQSKIFTPYFTTKESGTGLGLPIVERIVTDHGGTIWFNSAEGMGTTFFIDLPMDGSNDQEAKDTE
ncbi:sensor histidine kinase [Breznakiella homolactica]|nr:ATP-binding protein [Breznakiella homolactica]